MRYVLPITVFLKLKDLGGKALPSYEEFFLLFEASNNRKK